jgi:protein gp37
MGANSAIEWTDATWNPWQGCLKVSPGCKQCYMYRDKARYGQDPKVVVRSKPATFNSPLKWAESQKVFTCSWSDFFIEQADNWRDDAWDIIRRTPHLTYQVLTKRPENIKDRLPEDWGNGWPNVWLGVSVESKKYTWRLEALDLIPARVKFVSYEPALEYVDFTTWTPFLDWVISGGESGYNPRPASLDWFRQVRDDCLKNGVAFFHKQHGGKAKIDGVWGGRDLDGRTWDEFPTPKKEALEVAP